MPKKTLASLVAGAVQRGLDPETPAVAVARATRPDELCIAARIADLPRLLQQESPDGPVLVMLGRVFAEHVAKLSGEKPFVEPADGGGHIVRRGRRERTAAVDAARS
jgi:uroporphyrin-III C-methyltransferase/precorrin-2 dehydrogenase/sirohydrochlorin ferrochelatase